jgi:hypothetical protein
MVLELKLPEMTTPERALIRRRLNEGSNDKRIPAIADSKDPWVKGFVRRLAILIRDIGCGKPS